MKPKLLLADHLVLPACCWVVAGIVALIMCRSICCHGRCDVAGRGGELLPILLDSLLITAEDAAGGLAGSIVVGVPVALVFAHWRIRRLFFPYTILLQTVPILAIAPLIIIWVGAGLLAVMVVTFIICLAPIIANTTQGLISVDENLINLSDEQGDTGADLFKLRLPNALPNLFAGDSDLRGIACGRIDWRVVRGFNRGGRGRAWLRDHLREQPDGDFYLFALVLAATALGLLLFYRDVLWSGWRCTTGTNRQRAKRGLGRKTMLRMETETAGG